MDEVITPDAVIRFPEGLPIVCPTCRQHFGIGKVIADVGGSAYVHIPAGDMARFLSHQTTAHPTEGEN